MRRAILSLILLFPLLSGQQNSSAAEPASVVRLTTDGLFKQRPAWSPDGKWIAFSRHRGASIYLYLLSADGKQEKRLTKRNDPEYDAVWSPDGKRIAFTFVQTSPGQGNLEVYTLELETDEFKPVAVNAAKLSHEESPAWSPDGRWIAFSSTRDGNQELYIVRPDGKEMRRLTNHPAIDAHPTWSPDSRRIVFSTNRWGDLELAVTDLDANMPSRLTTSHGLDDYPAWSVDGKQIAFTSNRDRNFEIYTIDSDGENPRNLTRNPAPDNFPAWSSGNRITFVSARDGGFDIYDMLVPE